MYALCYSFILKEIEKSRDASLLNPNNAVDLCE